MDIHEDISCSSHEAAGVVCSRSSLGLEERCYHRSKVCLVGGNTLASGNVYVGGHPVCHNGWDFADANVLCRNLGYIGAADFTIKSFFGTSDTYFLFGDVDCRGDELSLDECPKSFSVSSCNTHTIAGVHCIPMLATHLPGHDSVIVGLTVTLSILIFIMTLMTIYIFKNRLMGLRKKVKFFKNNGYKNTRSVCKQFRLYLWSFHQNPALSDIKLKPRWRIWSGRTTINCATISQIILKTRKKTLSLCRFEKYETSI